MVNELKSIVNVRTKIFTFFLLILPVTNVYASPIPSVSWGETIMLCYMLLFFSDIFCNRKLVLKPIYVYIFYALLSTLIITFILMIISESIAVEDMMWRVIRDALYFSIILIYGSRYFDYQYAKAMIKRISIVVCVFMDVQFVVYAFFKFYLPGVFPSARTTVSGGMLGSTLAEHFEKTASYDGYARATGFFSEPAIAAQFLSVSLILVLFERKKECNYKLAIFYSVAMLLSFSVNAYVSLLFCWGIWYLLTVRKKRLLFVFAPAIMIIFFVVATKNNAIMGVFERGINLILGKSQENSAMLRILRGPMFYFEMPVLLQMFGSGFGNFLGVKEAFQITTAYEEAAEYLNTNSYILISSGIVGFALYIIGLFREVKHKILSAKMLVWIVLLFGLSSSIYSTAQYAIMLCFALYSPLKREISND